MSHHIIRAWPLFFLVLPITAIAQVSESNEDQWKQGIESDIRNGAPSDVICRNSLSPAAVSNDVSFKDWAYQVARQYCPPGRLGPDTDTSPDSRKECPFLNSLDARRATKGERVKLSGGGCVMIFN